MKYSKLNIYIALAIVVSFSVAFRSLTLIYFQVKKATIEQSLFPILYVAKMEANMEESRQEEVENAVEQLRNIANADVNLPILPWTGPAEYEEDWNRLWKAHMVPILFATSEFQVNPSERAIQLAGEIANVTGVTQVIWDQKRFQSYTANLDQWKKEEEFFSTLFFLFMAAIIGGLISTYPVRFRRDFVVRTGFGGAGSQVNPEGIWAQLILIHLAISIILYNLLFTLGYLFFPYPPIPPLGDSGFWSSLLEGSCITGTLSATVCLIGWWLKTEEVDAVTAIRPPSGGWGHE